MLFAFFFYKLIIVEPSIKARENISVSKAVFHTLWSNPVWFYCGHALFLTLWKMWLFFSEVLCLSGSIQVIEVICFLSLFFLVRYYLCGDSHEEGLNLVLLSLRAFNLPILGEFVPLVVFASNCMFSSCFSGCNPINVEFPKLVQWEALFHCVCPANNIHSEVSGKVIETL